MKISELMVKDVITCADTAGLGETAKLMWEHDIGFIPVISSENGAFAGVITDRDGFLTAHFQGRNSGRSRCAARCPHRSSLVRRRLTSKKPSN